MFDSNFRLALFLEEPNYEETLILDRKGYLYGLVPQVSSMNHETKAKFVRDFIAMANTASIYRKSAYLLLGIDDEGNISGLEKDLEPFYEIEDTELKVWERVRRAFADLIRDQISPFPKWELKHGLIGQQSVAYLLIEPTFYREPFRASRQIKGEIGTDESWLRSGESKQSVRPRQLLNDDWQARIDVPHPLPSQWLRQFASQLASRAYAEFREVPYYIDLYGDNGELLDKHVNRFIGDDREKLLVIRGEAGSGKSTFLKRLVIELTEESQRIVQDIYRNEQFEDPSSSIAHYFSLRDRDNDIQTVDEFTKVLAESINQYGCLWDSHSSQPEGVFERQELSWLIALDGLDEIEGDVVQPKFLGALKGFMDRYPRVKLLLTSRPHSISVDWTNWAGTQAVTLGLLGKDQVQAYIQAHSGSQEGADAFEFIVAHDELLTLCSYPSYLVAAMRKLGRGDEVRPQDDVVMRPFQESEQRFGIGDSAEVGSDQLPRATRILDIPEPISDELFQSQDLTEDEEVHADLAIGRILDSIYRYLWQREFERRRFLSEVADEWWERTGELALGTNSRQRCFRRSTATEYLESINVMYWLLNLGVLTKESTNLYAFFTELTKAYFAATHVRLLLQAREIETPAEILEPCHVQFREIVRSIVQDIS